MNNLTLKEQMILWVTKWKELQELNHSTDFTICGINCGLQIYDTDVFKDFVEEVGLKMTTVFNEARPNNYYRHSVEFMGVEIFTLEDIEED